MEALLDLAKDIWDYLKVRKKYWLAPLIITIVLMGALIVFTQGSVWHLFFIQYFKNNNKKLLCIKKLGILNFFIYSKKFLF